MVSACKRETSPKPQTPSPKPLALNGELKCGGAYGIGLV